MRSSLVQLVALVALCSCSSSSGSSGNAAPTSVTQEIGAEGGTIEVAGALVTFPKGALASSKAITISVKEGGAPEGFVALSKVFVCEPSGTDFAQPVTMQMPFSDDGKGGSMFWSSGADPSFKDVGGVVQGNTMVATVRHFSSGFVGRKN
ncbi:MAG: hypothetical protein KF819_06535 [Labilithrix sp.]|nr:hypothetical protein [Labilithrix sp.]